MAKGGQTLIENHLTTVYHKNYLSGEAEGVKSQKITLIK